MTDEIKEALERIKDFLEEEESSHRRAGNANESEEINDLLMDLEAVKSALSD